MTTAFDRLAALAGAMRAEQFGMSKVPGGDIQVFVDGYSQVAASFDEAVEVVAKRILDGQWRTLHEARTAVNEADQRIRILTRLGFT